MLCLHLYRDTIDFYLLAQFHHVQSQLTNVARVVYAQLRQATHSHVLVSNCFHLVSFDTSINYMLCIP